MQDEMAQIAARYLPADQTTIMRNETRLGVRENPKAAIAAAFSAGSEFNLCLEEDFLLAPDALSLADWYIANAQPHWFCLNLLASICNSRGNLSAPAHPDFVFESRCLSSIGLGFTRDMWQQIEPIWSEPRTYRRSSWRRMYHDGWDHALLAHLLTHPHLRTIQPVAARCTHLGAIGTYCREDFQRDAFDHIRLCPPLDTAAAFVVAPINDLPADVIGHAHALQDQTRRIESVIEQDLSPHSALHDWVRHHNRKRRERLRAKSHK